MRYVKNILLPDEQILLDARIHPAVLLPGLTYILLAAALVHFAPVWFGDSFLSIRGFRHIQNWVPILPIHTLATTYKLTDAKVVAAGMMLFGVCKCISAFIIISFTELVITDQRIIAKVGVMTTTSIEIDRSRVAGVVVFQTMNGRMLDYGKIYIQGFAGAIVDMDFISSPYTIQKYINYERRIHR